MYVTKQYPRDLDDCLDYLGDEKLHILMGFYKPKNFLVKGYD